jgi:urea transporter
MQNEHQMPWTKRKLGSFILASLKGISQVVFIENAIIGIIILLAITIASWILGIMTILSACIGTFIGKIGGADKTSVNQGLFGYNSVLTGIALSLYLNEPNHWIIALIGAALTAIFTAAIVHFMKNTGIPILTFPFIALTWFILLTTYRLDAIELTGKLVPQDLSRWELNTEGKEEWIEGIFTGIGQVFFLDNPWSGALLFIALFLAGWRYGVYAILGNAVALLASYWLGGEYSLIFRGLYGYNAILSILAVSIVFNDRPHRFQPIYSGVIVSCLSVLFTASIASWLLTFGLPTLTIPFVLTTWLLLAARKVLPRL